VGDWQQFGFEKPYKTLNFAKNSPKTSLPKKNKNGGLPSKIHLKNLVTSMPRRLAEVTERGRSITHY
jgi:hypothetical protein